jgi:UDP-glucose 4-epimerase
LSVLVTGAAGYIGSVAAALLRKRGEQIVILDNLSRGHRAALPINVPFYEGDAGDRALIAMLVREHRVTECMHFAAFAYVGESVEHPALYFENNLAQGIALIGALREAGVQRFVFSSSCATYGEPDAVPISEDQPQRPANPYGWSKLILEQVLSSYDRAYDLKFVSLRYFNAAGAYSGLGEHHDPEPHLIPRVLSVAAGALPHVEVYGTDYPTPDGTAIRDYIHIADLAQAHVLALAHLRAGGDSLFLNLGNGQGFSVREVIKAAERVTGKQIESIDRPRREGDPARLVACADRARRVLGWQPQFPDIDEIIDSAWRLQHPNG